MELCLLDFSLPKELDHPALAVLLVFLVLTGLLAIPVFRSFWGTIWAVIMSFVIFEMVMDRFVGGGKGFFILKDGGGERSKGIALFLLVVATLGLAHS